MEDFYTQILDWVDNTGLTFLVVSVILGIVNFGRFSRAIKVLIIYLSLNLVVQGVAYFLWQRSINNLPLLHLNTLLEFVCFSFFFKEVYVDQYFFKKNFNYFVAGISLLLILNSAFFESVFAFNTNAKVFVQLCLILYVILYLFDAFGKVDFAIREDQVISVICFAILIYYAGSLSTYLFSRLYTEEIKEGIRPIWVINGLLTALFQFILLIGILRLVFKPRLKV